MKHLIKDNQIIASGIPSNFTREDGETFWGGYETRTDIHFEDGWRDEAIPEIDPKMERLGDAFYNAETDEVNYRIIPIEQPPVEELKERLTRELKGTMMEFSAMIQMGMLLYKDNPELSAVIETIRLVKNQTVEDINTKSYEELRIYGIQAEDIEYLKGLLNPYMI